MNKHLENIIRQQLREANDMGARGFLYDPEEQDEDWEYFENSALSRIDDLLSNLKNQELQFPRIRGN